MTPREAFYQRVRQAVVEGNRAGSVREAPRRGDAGYQGGGPDPVERFARELQNAGGHTHVVRDADEAWRVVEPILARRSARRILLGKCPMLDRLGLAARLRQQSFEVHVVDEVTTATARDTFFQADAGLSGVEHLIAETGSVVMATKPEEPRSLSLLPPLHIAFAERRQILPDLFDLFDLFAPDTTPGRPPSPPPSCLTLITGPSKTGDIELRLVTGVHGPGELHVVVLDG
jgi:L-lactate dehydrogenase complex protein LldG